MEQTLNDLGRKLDALQAKAEVKGAQAKAEYVRWKAGIDKKLSKAKADLAEAKSQGGRWDDMKSGLRQAVDDIKKAFDDAAAKWGTH
jgi:hypothetical protein